MAIKDYVRSALTGGGAGALDKIDGTGLNDGDMAKVVTDAGVYWYHLNATSGATENSPFRINPDSNAGTKSWHLVGTTAKLGAGVSVAGQSVSSGVPATISWSTEDYDVGNFFTSGTPTKLTVPAGVDIVNVKAHTKHDGSSASSARVFSDIIRYNSSDTEQEKIRHDFMAQYSQDVPIGYDFDVNSGDYFIVKVYQNTGGTRSYDCGCRITPKVFS